MTDRLRLTILGCGSSPGTPRITGDWGNCDPDNPRNRRTRAAALVERIAANGSRTTVVIDTGPDFRQQMLLAGVKRVDAVVYTHPHADHIHGIDDLRGFVLDQRQLIDVHADRATMLRLREAFGYCFETPQGSSYPPIVRPHLIDHTRPVVVEGEGVPSPSSRCRRSTATSYRSVSALAVSPIAPTSATFRNPPPNGWATSTC